MSRDMYPLGTVNLNTPITSSNGSIVERSKSPLNVAYIDETKHEIKVDYIQMNSEIQKFIKLPHIGNLSQVTSVLNIINLCYTHLKHSHATNQLKQLIKQHLAVIGKLLCSPDEKIYEYLSQELVCLYNRSNWDQVGNLDDLLLADFTISNLSYLSTLKILTLQYIIKTKQMIDYNDTVLRLFAYDRRFLLKDSKIKINATMKILLSVFSTPVSYNKVLIGLKLVQYTKQYSLPFDNYIRNVNLETFTKQIRVYASKIDDCNSMLKYLNLYYSQFVLQDNFSLNLTDLTPNHKTALLTSIKDLSTITSSPQDDNLAPIYDQKSFQTFSASFLNILSDDSINIQTKLIISNFTYQNIIPKITHYDKNLSKLLDQTLLFLNSNLRVLNNFKTDLILLLNNLVETCMNVSDYQRLRNIVNVSYNAYLVSQDYDFLNISINREVMNFLSFNQYTTIKNLAKKFNKFITSVKSSAQRLQIFNEVFNFHLTSSYSQLENVFEFCKELFEQCYKNLQIYPVPNFCNASEVQMAILFGYSGIKLDKKPFLWSPTTFILYNVLNDGDNKVTLDDARFKSLNYHFLYKYEPLIKLCFYLKNEMIKRSSSNLFKLTKSYQIKILKASDIEINRLEERFVESLLLYLDSCQFYKISIELIDNLTVHKARFKNIEAVIFKWRVNALIGLMMVEDLSQIDKSWVNYTEDEFKLVSLDDVLVNLETKMQLIVWTDDIIYFHELFACQLPKLRSELFDIQNISKMPIKQYIKILLFNIQIFVTSSKLHSVHDNLVESVIEAKKALRLSITLVKKMDKLSQNSRLSLIQLITNSYENLINTYTKIGIAKDAEFYANEFTKTIGNLTEPTWVYRSLIFLNKFYSTIQNKSQQEITMQKANKTFTFIQKEHDIGSHIQYSFLNNKQNEAFLSLENYLNSTNFNKSLLPSKWRLELGEIVDDIQSLSFYNDKIFMNKIRQGYNHALEQLKSDPFFSGLLDSTLALPSCLPKGKDVNLQTISSNNFNKFLISRTTSRSSNMTPRLNVSKSQIDINLTVCELTELKENIESFTVTRLNNIHLSEISYIYSHCITLLAYLSAQKIDESKALAKSFCLNNLLKTMPLLYDKLLSSVESNHYESMIILTSHPFKEIVTKELDSILQIQSRYDNLNNDFDIVSIDVCPKTNHLLLSKFVSDTNERIMLRIPLNGEYLRDADASHYSFGEAQRDLQLIVEQNNYSVSSKVTSTIKTSGGRRKWWETRYLLDSKLKNLINKIEDCWFSGFRSILNDHFIDKIAFEDFKTNFYKTLQQYLPSRMKMGNSESFIQIEDWILKLFLDLVPGDTKYVTMIDDLIYFILDILLYHGEANAYDEIDLNQLHIQLVENIKDYQARVFVNKNTRNKKKHTFFIISDKCHPFPWENLSFLQKMSITRVPSYTHLYKLLEKAQFKLPVQISIKEKIGMVLNPHADLIKTEARFKDIFHKLVNDTLHSIAIIGQKPEEAKFLELIKKSNLFIYVGHGSGEQYARLKWVKQCDQIATSFLLGCSSASMKPYGLLQPTGSMYSYLQGGSPYVLGNLWDVTDKDIDKFSVSLFERSGLIKNLQGEVSGYQDVSHAVNDAREVCHLRYMNGASPVGYGLPIAFV